MSETKFTKGPWIVSGPLQTSVEKETGFGVCKMQLSEPVDINNAYLIACAPEMYEMLDEISDGLLDAGGYGNCALAKRIEQLLAKARGEK